MKQVFESMLKTSPKVAIAIAGTCGALYLGKKSVQTVPASHIAHTNLFGNIGTNKMDSGLHFINPLASLIILPLLTSNFSTDIDVATNEGLSLSVQVNTIYRLNEDKARDVYLKCRLNYEEVLIKPLIEATLRNTMASYEAKALYSDKTRNEIKRRLDGEIKHKLEEHGIFVTDVLVNKIRLPSQLQQSIEQKLRVEQENQQMAFTIEKKRQEIAFELEKEEMEAKRKTIEAEGIRKFQDIVSKGITPDLIKWKSIEATMEIAKSNNAKVVVVGNKDSNGLPIILGN